MRKSVVVSVALFLALSVSGAEVHRATPADLLRKQLPKMSHAEWLATADSPRSTPLRTPGDSNPETAKTFDLNAHRFSYGVSPFPFTVNVGDTVTINITATDVTHGFFLEVYDAQSHIIQSGTTTTVGPFVASQAGTFTFFCTNPCGTGHGGMDGVFTVIGPDGPPTITNFSPKSGPVSGGTDVGVIGTNFKDGATVTFGSSVSPLVTVSASTELTAVSPAHAAGSVAITLTNPGGESTSLPGFTYLEGPPSINSFAPTSGPTSGGNQVVITGAGFRSGATVFFGSFSSPGVTFVDGTTLKAVAPPHAAGQVTIIVTNPDDQSASRAGYTYSDAVTPTITSLSPAVGGTRGGTLVTIKGTGFGAAEPITATFGGAAATSVTVVDATTLMVTTPAHAAGKFDVVVSVGSKAATLPGGFTFATRRRPARP